MHRPCGKDFKDVLHKKLLVHRGNIAHETELLYYNNCNTRIERGFKMSFVLVNLWDKYPQLNVICHHLLKNHFSTENNSNFITSLLVNIQSEQESECINK